MPLNKGAKLDIHNNSGLNFFVLGKSYTGYDWF